jgi:feruloyl esterase
MRLLAGGFMIRNLTLLFTVASALAVARSPGERLKPLKIADTTITLAQAVAAGPYRAPNSAPDAATQAKGKQGKQAPRGPGAGAGPAQQVATILPAHCRVAVTLTPSPDSGIKMELWLPFQDWNGKFEAVGGGGWAGSISFAAMATALQENYATASTDTGHEGGNAN